MNGIMIDLTPFLLPFLQNAGLGVALALAHFEPQTALPAALFAVWCIITTAVLTKVLKHQGMKHSEVSIT